MYDLINTGSISFPKFIQIEGESKPRNYKVSDDAKNFITKLLEKDPGTRLGRKGLKEIKKHPFFSGISFDDLFKKKHKAPFKPTIDKNDITNNFDEEYLNMDISESPVAGWSKEEEYNNWFVKFDDIDVEDDFEPADSNEVDENKTEGGDE